MMVAGKTEEMFSRYNLEEKPVGFTDALDGGDE